VRDAATRRPAERALQPRCARIGVGSEGVQRWAWSADSGRAAACWIIQKIGAENRADSQA
jgi:hypothetical protein